MNATDTILNDLKVANIDLRRARRKLNRTIGRSGPKKVSSETSYLDADTIHGNHQKEAMTQYHEVAKCMAEIKEIEDEITQLRKDYNDIMQCALSAEKTWKKVYFLRFKCGLKHRDIAELIGISEDRCRHIASKLVKRKKQHIK